ncbi:iron ABC transporter [Sulfodiicoccus acidiphilus]|uniref:Iron ABC transporter n=1 Tax=Sulfodiicoccus acidiphilus TaxID=1670455 RepID=A0A348B689_9CREN|nr:iron ABC transporter [Sulfodiicoccus acidiphilus]GGT97693.1 iron ABC transporter [Sulfodiicoccus acidiphilus]
MVLVMSTIAAGLLGLLYGPVYTPLNSTGVYREILLDMKLPTVIYAALTGIVLAASGTVLQTLFRNGLMDPYVSGTAAGAAFGAVIAFFTGVPLFLSILAQPVAAFAFSVLGSLIVLALGRKGGPGSLLLAGLTVDFAFTSGLLVAEEYLQFKYPQLPNALYWLFGDVGVKTFTDVGVLLSVTLVFLYVLTLRARAFDLASLGDEVAYANGLNVGKFRLGWLTLTSLVVGYLVSQVGAIGFVGLMSPHMARLMGADGFRQVLLTSCIVGALVMEAANDISDGTFGFIVPITAVTSAFVLPIMIRLAMGLEYRA